MTEHSPRTATTYYVLRVVPDGTAVTYEPVAANVAARSAADALRQTVKTSGRYVAIPTRSFVPTTVTLEQQTVVKVGG